MIKNLHHCMNRFIDRRFDQFFFQYTFQLENKIAQNHRQRKILQWTATWYRLRINSFWISFAFQNIIKSIGGNFFVHLTPNNYIQLCKFHSRKTIKENVIWLYQRPTSTIQRKIPRSILVSSILL